MGVISVQGIGASEVTMLLDDTTMTAIKADDKKYDSAKGKAVALTGSNTVGFGTNGDALFGIIRKAEPDGVASVQYTGFAVNIKADATAAINKSCTVDGAGGIVAADAGRGYITAVNGNGTADILL